MNIFKRILLFILIKSDLLIWNITLFINFQSILVKNEFHIGELYSGIRWNKI